MPWISRLLNLFRQRDLNDDLDAEMASHIDEAIEQGRSVEEVRRAFGMTLKHREQSRDIKLLPWLDALASDILFGWRQITKHRIASAAAILSLALSIGAATAAYRLVDALMWRTLPVSHPERLYYVATTLIDREGKPDYWDDFDYPTFRRYRDAVADRADLMVVGITGSAHDVVFDGSGAEKLWRQYVSGNVFAVFGLQPALGRLLSPNDELIPGANPVAVLSYDYWTRRFGRDPAAVGKTFRLGKDRFEIIGIAPDGFIGTEPGVVTDVFIPATMNVEALDKPGWDWFRIWVHPKEGVGPEQLRQPMQAAWQRARQDHAKVLPGESFLLLPAGSGASGIQREYRRPLIIIGILVAFVLLIACANVGNLLTAQSAARVREMALRVSIGAGRWRLIQLVMVESALLAVIASALGALFASWAAPLVVSMLHVPEDPVRMVLNAGWREFVFSVALALFVTLLFGLAPALRASDVKPMKALRGGEDAHSRRRLMNSLLAAQMAFCILVQFVAGLFVATFERLSNKPLGFSPERVLILNTESESTQAAGVWLQVADRLRQTPGVESAALAGWPLLEGDRWTGTIRIPGRAPDVRGPYMLDVSPGYFATMRISLLGGREFKPGDRASGIVNEAFVRTYFNGRNPIGEFVDRRKDKDTWAPFQIVGIVRDAAYASVREAIRPTIYLPVEEKSNAAFLVRTAGDPMALASILRREVSQTRTDFRVGYITTESSLFRWNMVRERLLATLSFFFALVALALAAIGLYGVLNYSVTLQRREIGIRMALGARPGHVVRNVTSDLFAMICIGSLAGLGGGLVAGRFIETLLFEVKSTDLSAISLPLLTLFGATILAALPPALRAVRTDPATTLRSD